MSETLPLAQVKAKFSEKVDRVEHTQDRQRLQLSSSWCRR